ncbi:MULTISPECIES: DNA polymerase III subunit beta [Corynebacterium]|uniref:DNA polymerase III subunit beta n=1 Tax=Corynebacterium TaxID=1716 RepID=UPI00124E48F4|nr:MULTISPECIES: DNA polymerase III subunit beta [Corynebacterium]
MESQPMSFRVSKDDFSAAVGWVARSLPTKPTQPVLRGMVISADDDGLTLAGFDYEVSTKVSISAEIDEPGRIAVPGKLVSDIVSSLPNKPIEVRTDESKAFFRCGSSSFELPLIPLDDYPALPTLPEVTGRVNPSLFNEAVSQVAIAAGKDDTLPMLTGVHMKVQGKNVVMAATDRFRLAVRRFEWEPVADDVEAALLIPAKTLQENARSIDPSLNENVEIAAGTGEKVGADGLFGVHTRNRQTTTRMLDAEFPNYDPLLPKVHTSLATVAIGPLLDAIKRVSLVAERNAQIRMHFSEGQVVLAAGATDSGHAEESLPCDYQVGEGAEGQDSLLIAFNPSYLKEGLNAMPGQRVVFGFTAPSRPAIIIPEPDEAIEANSAGEFPTPGSEFTYLLMPVRLPG